MKEKNICFNVESDVNRIECDFVNADVSIEVSQDNVLKIEYGGAKNVHIGNGESGLIISQKKRLFCGRQRFKIFVPAYVIPSVAVNGKHVDFFVSGGVSDGIFGELSLNIDSGNIYLSSSVFESVAINGDEINASLDCATVKGDLYLRIVKGDVLAENTFATHCECRLDRGNIGLVNFDCKNSSFDTQEGNVTANLSGNAENFNCELIAREGTVNRESSLKSGAEGTFHAYAKKGNIVLDFTESKPLNVLDEAAATDAESIAPAEEASQTATDEKSEKEFN